jgi:hypothetical protein
MMPNHSKERDEAEARFKRAQKATQDPTELGRPMRPRLGLFEKRLQN